MQFFNLPKFFWHWLFIVLSFVYFTYHFLQGGRGVISLLRCQEEIAHATSMRGQLFQEKESLENKVKRMRPDHLCLDLLEEESKKKLNQRAPNEMVLVDKN